MTRPLSERLAAIQRRPQGMRNMRPGYPALFLASGSATKILAEVARLELTTVRGLPENGIISECACRETVLRLNAQGLIRRYQGPIYNAVLAINRSHRFHDQIRDILNALINHNNDEVPKDLIPLAGRRLYKQTKGKPKQEMFAQKIHPTYTMFGGRKRTTAILIVAALQRIDKTALARCLNVTPDTTMMRLFDPIEGDGILVSKPAGNFVTYELPDAPWSEPLRHLAIAICAHDKVLGSRLAATRTMMQSGSRGRRLDRAVAKMKKT